MSLLRTPFRAAAAASLVAAAALAARVDTGSLLHTAFDPWSNLFVVGIGTPGSVRVDGGTQTSEDSIALGVLGGMGSLLVTGPGSLVTLDGDDTTHAVALAVGSDGRGAVEVTDGGVIDLDGTANLAGDPLGASVVVGFQQVGSGEVTVSGAGSEVRVRNGGADISFLAVGLEGQGDVRIENGGAFELESGGAETAGVVVGGSQDPKQTTGVGTLTVTGAGSRLDLTGPAHVITVGTTGTGTLVVEQGAQAGSQLAVVGLEGTGAGTVRVASGATLVLAGTNPTFGTGGSAGVGQAGTGALEVLGGGSVVLDNQDPIAHGLSVGGAALGGDTGGTGSVLVDGPGSEIRIRGPLGGASIGTDGTGRLTVSNGGLFEVESPDGISGVLVGQTAGSEGTVLVTGAGSRLDAGASLWLGLDFLLTDTGAADVTVADGGEIVADAVSLGAGAVLRGDGTVTGNLSNLGGAIEPGTTVGELQIDGGATQSEGALRFEIAGAGPGEADALDVASALDLFGGEVELRFVGRFLPQAGDEWLLASAPGGLTLAPAVTTGYEGAAPGFDFEVVAETTQLVLRALGAAEGFGACQAAQLKAFSKLCRAALGCNAKYAKQAEGDPDGKGPEEDPALAKRDACLAKAGAGFAKSHDKALAKAARRGEACALEGSAADADDVVLDPVDAIVADVLAGFAPGASRDDAVLRARLLGESSSLCAALLAAESKHSKKQDAARRDASRARARGAFDEDAGDALADAAAQGVDYDGPGAGPLGDAVDAVAGEAVEATWPGSGL